MSAWKETKLGSLGKVITGKTPSKDNPDDWGNDVLFITPSDYKNYRKKAYSSIRMLSVVGADRQKQRLLPVKSVLVTCIGSDMGKTVVNLLPCVTNQQINAIIPNQAVIDPDYLYYITKDLYSLFSNLGRDGTAVPILNKSDFENIDVVIPELHEQKSIASILSCLDDKIDLLNRQNKTLEAMAETLFRRWFVEEAGEAWAENGLLDIVELVGGGTPATAKPEYWHGDVPWLSGGDIASSHKSFVMSSDKSISKMGVANSPVNLLPKYATVITARGTVGKFGMLAKPMTYSQSNYGVMPKIEGCYFFTYLLINHVVSELLSAAYGSVFDTITTTTFKDIIVAVPADREIKMFNKSISVYFEKKFANQRQICLLENLRDGLLPKLMSGEVRLV